MAIFRSLEGKARETVIEIDLDKLNDEDGVRKVLAQLDKLDLKDELQ